MNNPAHLDIGEARANARELAEARRSARADFVKYGKEEAQADHDYRKKKASAYAVKRLAGEPQTGAEIHANAESADDKLKRDTAHVSAKGAEQRIAELERDAAFLNRLIEWSMKLEGHPPPGEWQTFGKRAA